MLSQTQEVVLSLGSNQGDREAWLEFARNRLNMPPHICVTEVSDILKTDPVDVPEAYRSCLFLNQIVLVQTDLPYWSFSDFIHAVESEAGRDRHSCRNAPRTLDIDIITFGDLIVNDPEIQIPHPRAKERKFVLVPLASLRPDFRFPDAKETPLSVFLAKAK